MGRKHLLNDVVLINLLCSLFQERKQICNTCADPIKAGHWKQIMGQMRDKAGRNQTRIPNESFVRIMGAIIYEFNVKNVEKGLVLHINSYSGIRARSYKLFITSLDTVCIHQWCVGSVIRLHFQEPKITYRHVVRHRFWSWIWFTCIQRAKVIRKVRQGNNWISISNTSTKL